jgi:hypothetical protein
MMDEAAETPRARGIRGVAREVRTGDPSALMKSMPESSTQEVLAGLVERVTFHNVTAQLGGLRAYELASGTAEMAPRASSHSER